MNELAISYLGRMCFSSVLINTYWPHMSTYLHFPNHTDADPIHFYHANGFPAGVYTPLLSKLSKQFNVYALKGRATLPNSGAPSHNNWQLFADDLIELVESIGVPIVAMGHSMGASSTVLAALKRPDLFKGLVLIEPAMVSFPLSLLFNLVPKKLITRSKLVKGTLNKSDNWASPQEYLTYIRKFHGYSRFNETAFDAFCKHAIEEDSDGRFRLSFPKAWEAHNYTMPPYLISKLAKLDQLNIPTVAIRGHTNLFFTDGLWQSWQSAQKQAVFLQHKQFSHLFPLEGPDECIDLIDAGLKQLNLVTH